MSVIEVLKTPSVMRKAISSYLPLLVLILSARAAESFQWQTDEGWFWRAYSPATEIRSDMSWKGVEEIRFAPGMFKPDKSDFFSYALVFSLEPNTDLSSKAIKEQVLLYYQGLSARVSEGKKEK